jgi:hypothetical protein
MVEDACNKEPFFYQGSPGTGACLAVVVYEIVAGGLLTRASLSKFSAKQ